MNQIADLIEQSRGLWALRWKAIIAAWLCCTLGWAVVLSLPDRFEASSRVYVDTKTRLRPVLQGIAVETDVESQLDQVREALLSRPHLMQVARATGLDRGVRDPADMDPVLAGLRKGIRIFTSGTGRDADSLYTISYASSNRTQALAVVQSLVDSFVEGTLGDNRAGDAEAQEFLRQQIKEYAERLAAAEARLADFKKHNLGLVPGDSKTDYFSRLSAEIAGLQQSENQIAIVEARRAELQRQLKSMRPFVPGTASGAVLPPGMDTDISLRIQQNEAKLQELLLHYTDKHPEVIALKQEIEGLKRQEAADLADIQKGGTGSGAVRLLTANPVYQAIQIQLSQAEVELASIRGAIAEHKHEIESLQGVVDTAPEVEQQFARLDRDYAVTRSQYTALVDRLEKTKLSDDAQVTGIVKFKVIDPPAADFEPVWPNRSLFTFEVLLGGIVAGIAFVWLLSRVRPTVTGTRALGRLSHLTILGSISRVLFPERRARQRIDRRRLILACAALAAVCLILVFTEDPLLRLIHGLAA